MKVYLRHSAHIKALQRGESANAAFQLKLKKSRDMIPALTTLTQEKRERVLNSTAVQLIDMLKQGNATSVELLVTFYEQALNRNAALNYLVDTNFEEALKLARKCDTQRHHDPSSCTGLLFGLPMSIKESFGQKGFPLTSGCIAWLDNIVEKDAVAVQLLREEGAIPFIRTNIPQVLSTSITTNHIWGETKNPWDTSRSAGGSSGGEAAVICSRGSPLGIGTDMGGSIRIPAAFCGIYGFKPTGGRTPFKGHDSNGLSGQGMSNIPAAVGPLGISVDDLELICKTLMSERLYKRDPYSGDPYVPKQPWKGADAVFDSDRKLKFGYAETFDFLLASEPTRRAVRETVAKLRECGHEVVEVKLPFFDDYVSSHLKLISGDGNLRSLRDKLKGEKLMYEYQGIDTAARLGWCSRALAKLWLRLRGESKLAMIIESLKPLSAYEYLLNSSFQKRTQTAFFKIWEENKLDAFICPGYPIPAMKTRSSRYIMIAACYTRLFNYLNLPAGSLPVTRVTEGEDHYTEKTGAQQEELERKTAEDIKGSVGMPLNIQVATLPWEDEKCIAAMKLIEQAFPFYSQHKFPIV